MAKLNILNRNEIETLGPPTPEEMAETDISTVFLCDLTLRHVAMLADPTTATVAEKLQLPRALAEEILYQLYREKLIELRAQSSIGSTRYAMLDHGWKRVVRLQSQSSYLGPAPVSLADYTYMMRLQAVPSKAATIETVRAAFRDLVLPESLLQTLGCAINSRTSLFLTGLPGTGKTAVSERVNAALSGTIWIPYALEIDGQVIRVFDSHCHDLAHEETSLTEYDRRWVRIQRPFVMVGGELTLDNTDLRWSETARFYEAPFQLKSNGGTLVIDDFGRQRVSPRDLLNRWLMPLERRIDFLTMNNGKSIEVPFEQLVVFSTNLNDTDLVDEAFLRRMAYRARVEPASPAAYVDIFKRAAAERGIKTDYTCIEHVLNRYQIEDRQMKPCEPRDILNRVQDICLFEGLPPILTIDLVDLAWKNYFGRTHTFDSTRDRSATASMRG